MRKNWFGVYGAVGCVVALTLAPASSFSQSRTSSSADHVIFRGCVELAAPQATGTTGNTDAKPDEAHFVLTDAVPAKPAAADTAVGANLNPFAAKTFRLDGTAVALTPHIGHRVEITGTIEDPVSAPASGGASPTPPSSAPAPKLKVESVQMVAALCSGVVARN